MRRCVRLPGNTAQAWHPAARPQRPQRPPRTPAEGCRRPFQQLAAQHTEMVCGMNLALIDGLIEGFGANDLHPELDPRPGRCCVVIIDDSQPAEATTPETTTGAR
jgi:hypothetical protein